MPVVWLEDVQMATGNSKQSDHFMNFMLLADTRVSLLSTKWHYSLHYVLSTRCHWSLPSVLSTRWQYKFTLFPFHQVALDFILYVGGTLNEDGELEDLVSEMTKYVMEGTQHHLMIHKYHDAFCVGIDDRKLEHYSWILRAHLNQASASTLWWRLRFCSHWKQ